MTDAINPKHYQFSKGVQVIDITENLTSNGGQAVQYIARSTRLDGVNKGSRVEDLDKAIWFCQREKGRIASEVIPAPVEAPVARVFNVGDPEPADKETIVLRGVGNDSYGGVNTKRIVNLKWGQYGVHDNLLSWWDIRPGDQRNTYSPWEWWLETFAPLTEVLDAPFTEVL